MTQDDSVLSPKARFYKQVAEHITYDDIVDVIDIDYRYSQSEITRIVAELQYFLRVGYTKHMSSEVYNSLVTFAPSGRSKQGSIRPVQGFACALLLDLYSVDKSPFADESIIYDYVALLGLFGLEQGDPVLTTVRDFVEDIRSASDDDVWLACIDIVQCAIALHSVKSVSERVANSVLRRCEHSPDTSYWAEVAMPSSRAPGRVGRLLEQCDDSAASTRAAVDRVRILMQQTDGSEHKAGRPKD